jgi:hypothetical protein
MIGAFSHTLESRRAWNTIPAASLRHDPVAARPSRRYRSCIRDHLSRGHDTLFRPPEFDCIPVERAGVAGSWASSPDLPSESP